MSRGETVAMAAYGRASEATDWSDASEAIGAQVGSTRVSQPIVMVKRHHRPQADVMSHREMARVAGTERARSFEGA